jgi:hypothetical protein
MKKVLLLTLAISFCASMAFGQAGGIGLFVTVPYNQDSCYVEDTGAALVPVYAVHMYCPGATASQWMLVTGGGWNCTYTGEIVHMPTSIGNTQAGISLGYGGCKACPLLVVTINYFCMGTSPTCAYLQVVGDPASGSGTIEVVDCAFARHVGCPGGKLYANADETCDPCVPLPTRQTSWGKIKTLYSD